MPRLSVWMIRAALLHLGVGFTFGALILAQKGVWFAPQVWRLLPAHVELLIFGWMIQLAMGVAYWALPRFSGVNRYGKTRLGWWSFALLNIGILITSWAGYWGDPIPAFIGRIITLGGVVCFTVMIWERVKPLGGDASIEQQLKAKRQAQQ